MSSALLGLPMTIADQILEKLGPLQLLICRRVCRNLRNAVDNFPIHEIYISFWDDSIFMDMDELTISFKNTYNGCTSVYSDGFVEYIVGRENYFNIAFNALKSLLNRVTRLQFEVCEERTYDEIAEPLLNMLKEKKCVSVEKLGFGKFYMHDITSFVPYFNVKHITFDYFYGSSNIFEQITGTDQWKTAKTVKLFSTVFSHKLIEHLFHFEEFTIRFRNFPVQVLNKMRDELLRRNTFRKCRIEFDSSNQIELANVFQPDYTGNKEYMLKYSNNNGTFDITCKKVWNNFEFHIVKC